MGLVITIPGTFGSQLFFAGNTYYDKPVWADPGMLATFGFDPMRLKGDRDGTPASKLNVLSAYGTIKEYYKSGHDALQRDLAGTANGPVLEWYYDWRMAHIKLGQDLADGIMKMPAEVMPVTLVGHSLGAIVARLAYRALKKGGNEGKVNRIISLGGPHKGTCKVVRAFQGVSKEGIGFAALQMLAAGLKPFQSPLPEVVRQNVNVMMTWPSFYDLLPTPRGEDTARDDLLREFYSFQYYDKTSQVGQVDFINDLANYAKVFTNSYLADPDSIPPGRKMVCVVGKGWPTWDVLGSASKKNSGVATWEENDRGDGTVTMESATIEGAQIVEVDHPHDRLFKTMAESHELAYYINENFAPTVMTPVPVRALPIPPPNDTIRQMPVDAIPFPVRQRGRPKR